MCPIIADFAVRSSMRASYNIQGDLVKDCLIAFCCPLCVRPPCYRRRMWWSGEELNRPRHAFPLFVCVRRCNTCQMSREVVIRNAAKSKVAMQTTTLAPQQQQMVQQFQQPPPQQFQQQPAVQYVPQQQPGQVLYVQQQPVYVQAQPQVVYVQQQY